MKKTKIGIHVSIAGGVDKAPQRAKEYGCDCFQIFVANPRSWSLPKIAAGQARNFIAERERLGLSPVVVHATYLPNPAASEKTLCEKSRAHLCAQYIAARDIGADFFVMHPGSHKGAGTSLGIEHIAGCMRSMARAAGNGPIILLENTVGAGNSLGATPQELKAILDASGAAHARAGICFDTCHGWAMGHDIARPGAIGKLIGEWEKIVFKGCIRLIHLNDSMFACGAGRDRHWHIGLGKIGAKGFKSMFASAKVRSLPLILETPIDKVRDDPANMAAARKLGRGQS